MNAVKGDSTFIWVTFFYYDLLSETSTRSSIDRCLLVFSKNIFVVFLISASIFFRGLQHYDLKVALNSPSRTWYDIFPR